MGTHKKASNAVVVRGVEYELPEITADWLLARVKPHPERDDCLIWDGHIAPHGQPQTNITLAPYVHRAIQVRRLVWMAMHPTESLPSNRYATTSCLTPGCVAPEHVIAKTPSDNTKRFRPHCTELHKARIAAARRKASKVSQRDIDETIWGTELTGPQIAKLLDVNPSYASQVRRGLLRQNINNNPFKGLIHASTR